jgi:hypothetical protein
VKLTTQVSLELKLIIRGDEPPFAPLAFLACTWPALPFTKTLPFINNIFCAFFIWIYEFRDFIRDFTQK